MGGRCWRTGEDEKRERESYRRVVMSRKSGAEEAVNSREGWLRRSTELLGFGQGGRVQPFVEDISTHRGGRSRALRYFLRQKQPQKRMDSSLSCLSCP